MEPRITDIAIIGMAGRFPGARDIAEFWNNLCAGIESIRHFGADELEIANAETRAPNYVRARAIMADVDQFDAAFFGIYPREAELIDPQQRIFLECCWHAFEDAGYDPLRYPGMTGVYAGCSPNSYFMRNLGGARGFIDDYTAGYPVSNAVAMLGANADFLATRVAYKLNLRGPAFTINCACSTSLVAVGQAGLALQNFQCDLALAGGVSINLPQRRGYLYEAGGMVSGDGHCRTFDEAADGTVFGDGAGVVLLKRLEEAISDGDRIYAVIRGFGVNNDGAQKVGYAAPGVEGQAQAIAMAQAAAEFDPRTISYIEAHGTATPLGDPIELAALTQAFRRHTSERGFCALGTAKTNIGHLEAAAGVTGLIKTALSLHRKMIPPVLHYRRPNAALNLDDSPFYVNATLRPWDSGTTPRRAGVSAFGIGGTNAHAVLEEMPEEKSPASARGAHLVILSARSGAALEATSGALAQQLTGYRESSLADVAYTLMVGRHPFEWRQMTVAADAAEAARSLIEREPKRVALNRARPENFRAAFMFPGQGAQYVAMGRELCTREAAFREAAEECLASLEPELQRRLRELVLSENPAGETEAINNTQYAQPALFIVEYALAQLLEKYGIQPAAMIGHSVGEFVAATLAGVFSAGDALRVVAERGRLMQEMPAGAMLALRAPESTAREFLGGELSIAAINAPLLSVIAGPLAAIVEAEAKLGRAGVVCRRLRTSHAFHSSMMEPVLERFAAVVANVKLRPPQIPFVSGVSGRWISDSEATDPQYWTRHLRAPVRFSDGITMLRTGDYALVEVGPGNTLVTLARQHAGSDARQLMVSSMPDGSGTQSGEVAFLNLLGRLWLHGGAPEWSKLYEGERRLRVALPLYPFERKRFWIEANTNAAPKEGEQVRPMVADAASDYAGRGGAAEAFRQQEKDEEAQLQMIDEAQPVSRKAYLQAMVAAIFEELSGIEAAAIDGAATFLELGFDSLFLTQVSQAILSKFALKITFRQLLDKLSTLESLAAHLDEKLAPETFQPPTVTSRTPAAKVAESAAPIAAAIAERTESIGGGGALEDLFKQQLATLADVMAKQLEALRGAQPVTAEDVVKPRAQSMMAPAGATPPGPSRSASPVAGQSVAATSNEVRQIGRFRPIEGAHAGELTTAQRARLDDLIARYTRRTAKSKAHVASNRGWLADPRNAAGFRREWKELVYPIVAARSQGSKFWDLDGNEYIDVVNGFGPILFGHAPEFIKEAVAAQLEQGWETGPQTALAGEVAELLCELTGMERASFCTTGSEAVVAAVRLARTVTGRMKIAFFNGSYHGMFDEVLVKSVKGAGGFRSLPLAPGIPREKVENVVVLDYGTAEALKYLEEHVGELAAVMVEPVQSRHPGLQPVEFLREVRRLTEKAGTALIFDEVVTGFRVHQGGAQALFGIRADIATYGKVIGGGLPIGVVAGKASFMDALDGGPWQNGDDSFPETGVTFFAGTFFRHPLTLAAVRAALRHFKAAGPELQIELGEKTERLVGELNAILAERGVPTRVESFGAISYFSFPAELTFASLFYYCMRERGIYIQEGFPLFLTTAHSDDDLAQIVRAFRESIVEMQAAGFLPHESGALVSGVDRVAETGRHPLSEAQREVWLAANLSQAASCCFNESFSLFIRGALDADALSQALNRVIARHDALRARFSADGEYQEFAPVLDLDIAQLDLSATSAPAQTARIDELIREDAAAPFDLVKGPLIRAQLIKLDANDYRLIVTTHHIVCDGWSTNVMLEELAQIYNGLRTGIAPTLPVAMQFAEYVAAEQAALTSDERESAHRYWIGQFAQPVTPLALPSDRPRRSSKGYAGASYRRTIDAAATQRIRQAGAREGCTLFATLLAGFDALLARLGDQQDVVVGIPTAGQSMAAGENLVGHCVNLLPIRADAAPEKRFAELLALTKRNVLDAYDHQNYTYGTLVRSVNVHREAGRLPLLDVQFNLERVGNGAVFHELETRVEANPKSFVNFDLFLNVVEGADGLVLDCDYSRDLFDEETIDRWLGHYETLLEGFAADAGVTTGRLPMLAAAERERMLVEWNRTATDYPQDRLAHQLFAEQAARTPAALAAIFAERALTYAELDARANQVANYLGWLGVPAGAVVAIYVERSLDMIVALLGVMKAGCTYLPLDPIYPAERIRFMLEETAAAAVLTQSELENTLGNYAGKRVCFDRDRGRIEAEPAAPAASVRARPDDLAYVIYTSGSTGRPKGVEISNRALVNLLVAMCARPGFEAADGMLAVTTLSFDIAALELLTPLIAGGRVVIASREMTVDGTRLLAELQRTGATVMQATPTTWRLLLEAGWSGEPRLKMLCGGEAMPKDLAERLIATGGELWNMYGPTETTIWSACARIADADRISLGRPIANTQFYVIDRYGEPVAIGVPGELYIGGDGVARGYLKREELTRGKFVADGYRAEANARLFKTGDTVRFTRDGEVSFVGRGDNQVKLRGYRIELGEIEALLAGHPGVKEAAVALVGGGTEAARLVAYVVYWPGAEADSSELRALVRERLPEYMTPSQFVALKAMPLTHNGKLDRKALPLPAIVGEVAPRESSAPATPDEEALCEIWQQVLALARVGIHDDIFELGGDSVHIFRIAARARQAGLQIEPLQIFEFRTIAEVLKRLASNGQAPETVEAGLAPTVDRGRNGRIGHEV